MKRTGPNLERKNHVCAWPGETTAFCKSENVHSKKDGGRELGFGARGMVTIIDCCSKVT